MRGSVVRYKDFLGDYSLFVFDLYVNTDFSEITSKLSERPLKSADQKTERGKILNPEYNICRDQPTSWASPLRINALLSAGIITVFQPHLRLHALLGRCERICIDAPSVCHLQNRRNNRGNQIPIPHCKTSVHSAF